MRHPVVAGLVGSLEIVSDEIGEPPPVVELIALPGPQVVPPALSDYAELCARAPRPSRGSWSGCPRVDRGGARSGLLEPLQQVRPVIQRMVDSIASPATVGNMRGDFVYANALGRALYAPMFDSREQPPNAARFTFLDPAAQQFFTDWEQHAKDLVAALRSEAGRNPYDRALTDLIGELSTRSEPFRKWWAAHNVRYHDTGRKRLHHPTVGDLELDYEVMQLSADSGLLLAVFSAEPGSRSAAALDLLASWSATPDPASAPGDTLR